MRKHQPSSTAAFVAAIRGVDTLTRPGFADDRFAEALVPPGLSLLLKAARRAAPAVRVVGERIDAWSAGSSGHMAFRTRAIDEGLAAAVASGVDQIVIVGAGFDARAHRLASLKNADVIEIDHPATQAVKRERAASLPIAARSLRYAATDFEGDGLRRGLESAGHDPKRASAYVWEGVTMYLTRGAIDGTLDVLAQRSPKGSRVLATYFDASAVSLPVRVMGEGLALFGEPLRSRFSPQEMAAVLTPHGFGVIGDEGDDEWLPRYFKREATAVTRFTSSYERLVIAERDVTR